MNKKIDDKDLNKMMDSFNVPDFDESTMEKRVIAAIERGAISEKFCRQTTTRARRSFWQTIGRETVGMAMVACMVLAVLIHIPNVNVEPSNDIELLVSSLDTQLCKDYQEEMLLDDILSVAENGDNDADIEKLIDELSTEEEYPEDYWEYFMDDNQDT